MLQANERELRAVLPVDSRSLYVKESIQPHRLDLVSQQSDNRVRDGVLEFPRTENPGWALNRFGNQSPSYAPRLSRATTPIENLVPGRLKQEV